MRKQCLMIILGLALSVTNFGQALFEPETAIVRAVIIGISDYQKSGNPRPSVRT